MDLIYFLFIFERILKIKFIITTLITYKNLLLSIIIKIKNFKLFFLLEVNCITINKLISNSHKN